MTGMIVPRRRFLIGAAAALAMPAIVKFENIMPVRAQRPRFHVLGTFVSDWMFHRYDLTPMPWATAAYIVMEQDADGYVLKKIPFSAVTHDRA